jgi:hypothetical protein
VFLKDGTAVSSYGEYARVGDRVVFSMQIGEAAGQPRLQLVTLPSSEIDWPRTEEYLDSVRSARYAASRGEADYADLTSRVAAALHAVASTGEPARRLEIVEQVRREVADWPRTHYGYRAKDVAEISGLLDEAVSELRAATGSSQFDLNLVASIGPPARPLLPTPTPAEAIEQVLSVARRTDVPVERLSLLQAAKSYVEASAASLSKRERRRLSRAVRASLDAEMAVDRKYADLARRAIAEATLHAAEGDVREVETVLADINRADERLGRRRKDQMAALVATVEAKLDRARRLRLARDQWTLKVDACRSYGKALTGILDDLARSRRRLEDIKKLAGPDATSLSALGRRLAAVATRLSVIVPPSDLLPVHALLASSVQLATHAVQIRQQAVRSGDVSTAWNASAAAAGSMMLLERARQEMDACLKPPELR